MPQTTKQEFVDDALVARVLEGDLRAWRSLQDWAAPHVERWSRSHPRMRRAQLHRVEDDVREVLTQTIERLARDDFRNLSKYLEQSRLSTADARSLEQWLYGVTDYVIREHVRGRYGRAPTAKPEDAEDGAPRLSKRDVHTLAGRVEAEDRALAHRSEVTSRLTAREIMSHVREMFSAQEAEAVRLCFEEGASYPEIAEALGLSDAAHAETLVRKLKERLRVRFREA